MTLYLFNPEHDMALASFSPYYKAPAEIIRMRNDLSALPAWYGDKGSFAAAPSADYVTLFRNQCVVDGLFPYGELVASDVCGVLGANRSSVDDEGGNRLAIVPWGWDPALAHSLNKVGVDASLLPDVDKLQQIRRLSGRQQCVSVLNDFTDWEGVCGEAHVCTTLEEVRDFLSSHEDVILKAPWSGSGRGLIRTSLAAWTPNLEGWVGRILRTQGSIMAEPIYNKVIDFAMEFHLSSEHHLSFAGYSLFETDSHGNYKENLLASNEEIVSRLTRYVSVELLEAIRQQLLESLSRLLGADYVGYFGVDMMICRQATYVVHPCVEINLRMNMGVVARLLYDRYFSEASEGSYVVEHYATDGEALEHDRQLRAAHPATVVAGKMVEGYFSLTPVSDQTRYQCYVLCHKKE